MNEFDLIKAETACGGQTEEGAPELWDVHRGYPNRGLRQFFGFLGSQQQLHLSLCV